MQLIFLFLSILSSVGFEYILLQYSKRRTTRNKKKLNANVKMLICTESEQFYSNIQVIKLSTTDGTNNININFVKRDMSKLLENVFPVKLLHIKC